MIAQVPSTSLIISILVRDALIIILFISKIVIIIIIIKINLSRKELFLDFNLKASKTSQQLQYVDYIHKTSSTETN